MSSCSPPQLRDGRPAAEGHPGTAAHRHPHRQAVGHHFGHHARRAVRLPRALGGRTRAARQRSAVRHPAAELVHAGARRPADDVGAARDGHGRQPDRHGRHQPDRRPRRRRGRRARADPPRLGRADPGADRPATGRLRRTRAAGVRAHRRAPATVVDVTLDQVRASLIGRGMAEWEADHFREMYELFRAGESEFVTDTVREVTGPRRARSRRSSTRSSAAAGASS